MNAHYVLASDPTNGQDVTIAAGQPQTITVALKHATNDIQDSKDVVETIHYQYADGTQAHADNTQDVKFSRTGTRDLVTNSDNWQAWTPASGTWAAVTSPTITGYTPSQATVTGKNVTATTPDADVTVIYTKGNEPSKLGQVTINFVDQDDNNRIISSKQFSGQVGADSRYNTKADIDALVNQHYVLSNDETNGKDVIIADGQPTYTVFMKHGSKQVQDTKTVTETIHYQYIDGTPAANDHVATIQFTRHGVHDEVNGNDTWDPWTSDGHSFAAVDSPVLDGYTAHPATVAARTVNSDTPSQEITVVYLKKDNGNSGDNNGNKGNQQPGQPGQPTQPGNDNSSTGPNTQPGNDHGSTTQPSGNQPAGNRPVIDDSLISGGQNGFGGQSYVQAGQTNNGQTIQTGQANVQTPTGYKWETLRVLVPNSINNQQRLPQTGNAANAQRQAGFAVTLLAAILGIFGISLTGFKKDHND